MESVAGYIKSSDDLYLFVLIFPGSVLIIELIACIVPSFEHALFALSHNSSANSLQGWRLGLRGRWLSRLPIGLLVGRCGFRVGFG